MALALVPDREVALPEVVDTATLVEALGLHKASVGRRVEDERWPFREERCRGGRRRLYPVDRLPEDVQVALVRHLTQRVSDDVAKEAQAPVELALVRDTDRETALQRATVVEAWQAWARAHRRKYSSVRAAQDAFCADWSLEHAEQALSRATLVRWRAAYQAHGVAGLVPGYRDRGAKAEWPDAARLYLKAVWLRPERPGMALAIRQLRGKAVAEGWSLPSDQTLRRYLQGLPRPFVVRMREGAKAFNEQCLPYIERRYDDLLPNDVWVADHKIFDVFVRDPADGAVFRPWLSAYLDVASRRLVGRCLGRTPSSDTIVVAFGRGARRNGVPAAVYQDNGRDYSSRRMAGGIPRFRQTGYAKTKTDEEMAGVYRQLDVACHFALPGNARAKIVERWFGTLISGFERTILKGYVDSSPKRRAETAEEARRTGQVLELAEFEQLFDRWVDEVYHRTPHTGEGMHGRTPDQAWTDGLARGAEIRMASPRTLAFLMGQARQVRVSRQGVRVEKRHFWSEDLVRAADVGSQVVVRYDREDLAEVQVFDLAGRWLAAAAAVERTGYFDKAAPEVLGHKRKVARELHAAAVDEVRAAQRGLDQTEVTLCVPTVGGAAERPQVVTAIRTPLDQVARQAAQAGEERKVERARAKKAAETLGRDLAQALGRPTGPPVAAVGADARAELFADMDRALKSALGVR